MSGKDVAKIAALLVFIAVLVLIISHIPLK
jgi:hypothetical protein